MIVERLNADDEGAFAELAQMLLPMAAEVGVVPVDPPAAFRAVWLAASEGNTFVARLDEGRIVGVLCLERQTYWYNPAQTFLADKLFYVAADQRFALVGVKLLKFAKANAEPGNEAIFVRIQNRNRRPSDPAAAFSAQVAGYVPFGHDTVIRKPEPEVASAEGEA